MPGGSLQSARRNGGGGEWRQRRRHLPVWVALLVACCSLLGLLVLIVTAKEVCHCLLGCRGLIAASPRLFAALLRLWLAVRVTK